jgi:hypothetical protein
LLTTKQRAWLALRPSTTQQYQGLLRQFLKWIKTNNVLWVDAEHVVKWTIAREVLPSTARTGIQAVQTSLRLLGYPLPVDHSWVKGLQHLGIFNPQRQVKPLPLDVWHQIMQWPRTTSQEIEVFTLAALLTLTGRRMADAMSLQQGQLQLLKESKILRMDLLGVKEDTAGKGEQLEIPIPQEFQLPLQQWLARATSSGSLFLFHDEAKPQLKALMKERWGTSPKAFRVALATRLTQAGVPLEDIALLTGHHDLEVLSSHYVGGRLGAKQRTQMSKVAQANMVALGANMNA